MAGHVESSRNNCALIGAIQTVQAIEGAVPIIHSTAGCGMQQYLGGSLVSGCSGSGYSGGLATPSTNIIEKHVVFGGSSRLREQIKNTLKLVKSDLYVVLSGCATELVGDDVPAMAKEAREQGHPVVYANTPGFRGGTHHGYELAVKALIEQLPALPGAKREKVPGLVTVLGIIPNQDVFWEGNLLELKRILESVGAQANTLFGLGQGVEAWRQLPEAELTLVFSPWGVEGARLLEERYGTPWVDFTTLPVGAEASGFLLETVTERLNLDRSRTAAVLHAEERSLAHFLERVADAYFAYGFQREFALVGESGQVPGLTGFLVNALGLIPGTVIITDNPPEPRRAGITARIRELAPTIDFEVVFTEDSGRIRDVIRQSGAELVLGSFLESEAARDLGAPLVQVSFPVIDRVVLSRSHIGYRGALTLLEDLGSAIVSGQIKRGTAGGSFKTAA
ncbi:MAG: nitrogenase molybdenum-iron protein alpha and beta [Geobacteraceae bacterium]|nr:MAG: nitrogenase molybdenum-iron protein alpha and beta [Geobacteraceae bacterium]